MVRPTPEPEPTATCATCNTRMVRLPDGIWRCPVDQRHGDRMWPDGSDDGAAHPYHVLAAAERLGSLLTVSPPRVVDAVVLDALETLLVRARAAVAVQGRP